MYHSHYYDNSKLSEAQIHQVAGSFLSIRKAKALARYFMTSLEELEGFTARSPYRQFLLPKQEGGERLISTPTGSLREIQRHLNHSLQCVYYSLKPANVYGFVIHARKELEPRNIYTHACRHLKKEWVMSLDIEDFYPSITYDAVEKVFRSKPFRFSKKAARLLASITTHANSLPVGAPSSPIISNFVAFSLDKELQKLAERLGLTFTRFSDDLIFSSEEKIPEKHMQEIARLVEGKGFNLNAEKCQIQHKDDPPSVTGLVLKGEYPDVSTEYLKNLKEEIRFLKAVLTGKFPAKITHSIAGRLKRSIQGQINFIGFIRGRQHKSYLKLQYQLALVMANA